MLRMSFMEHLEELRSRIIRALAGFGVAFLVCLWFAVADLGLCPGARPGASRRPETGGQIIAIDPMEQFSIIWMWAPLVASFLSRRPG